MPLFFPVSLSVSASISLRTSSKSVNFFPFAWRNSAHSGDEEHRKRDSDNVEQAEGGGGREKQGAAGRTAWRGTITVIREGMDGARVECSADTSHA